MLTFNSKMADQANEGVIVVESDDDDDDVLIVDANGVVDTGEHDVIFVRSVRRRTNTNRPFLSKKPSSKCSEKARNQLNSNIIHSADKDIRQLVDKMGSPERPSDPIASTLKRTPKLEKLSYGTATCNADVKPFPSGLISSPLSPDSADVKNVIPQYLLSPLSPSASMNSTDIIARNSPCPSSYNRHSLLSPASPVASIDSPDLYGKCSPSQCSDDVESTLLSPTSPATSINSTHVVGRNSPFSDDRDSTLLSLNSPATSINSTDVVGRNSPFSDGRDSTMLIPSSFSPFLDDRTSSASRSISSTNLGGGKSPSPFLDIRASSVGGSISSTNLGGWKSPSPFLDDRTSSVSGNISGTDHGGGKSPSPFLDDRTSSVSGSISGTDHGGGKSPSPFLDDRTSSVSGSISGTDHGGGNSSSPFSDDADLFLLSPTSSSTSTGSADFSATYAYCSSFRTNKLKSTVDKSARDCSDGVCTNVSSVCTEQSRSRCSKNTSLTPCARVASQPTESTKQDCTCSVAKGFCLTSIANLNNKDAITVSKDHTKISHPAASSQSMSSMPGQTRSTIISNNMDSSKSTLGETYLTNVTNSSESPQSMTGIPQKLSSSGTSWPHAAVKIECACDITIGPCHSCLVKLDKSRTTTTNAGSYRPMPTVTIKQECICGKNTGPCQSQTCVAKLNNADTKVLNRPLATVSDLTARNLANHQSTSIKPNAGAYHSKRTFDYAVSSTSDISIVLSKKQRLAPTTSQPLPSTSGLSSSDTHTDHNLCFSCGILITTGNLSQCLYAHRCCSQCLQEQAKSLLTKSSKGSLKCFYPGCESFYPLSQLRKALPPMVIEIVEEKLEQEYLENATKMMMGHMSENDRDRDSFDKQEKVDPWALPSHWEPMDVNGDMRTVEVAPGSDSYFNVAIEFHDTMYAPRAEILRIRRVQNPILWQFYSVKRKQMLQENGTEELREMKLFHGTSNSVIDAICKSNFDWRLCGTHGTVFGQGSYFARDAKYAHMYTDGGNATMRTTSGTAGLTAQLLQRRNITFPLQLYMMSPTVGSSQTQVSVSASQQAGFNANVVPGRPTPAWPNSSGGAPPQQLVRLRHTMFVARVLVGKYTIGYNVLRKPPPLNPNDAYGKSYDSCVNDVNDPRIYVIFDNAQCYPEYIIEYTNVPRWALNT